LVASIALAAYLVSSAERTSISTTRSWLRLNGAYRRRITATDSALVAPMMMRSGRMQSATASPSFRNSGLDTTSKAMSAPCRQLCGNGGTHLVGGAHRHRRLVDHHGRHAHVPADGSAGHGQHVLQVSAAILVRRRADGDEHDLAGRSRPRHRW
jgi:hypothetical protein